MENKYKQSILSSIIFLLFISVMPMYSQNYPYTLKNNWEDYTINKDEIVARNTASGEEIVIKRGENFLFVENQGLWLNQHFNNLDKDSVYIINPDRYRTPLLIRHKQKILELSCDFNVMDISGFTPLGDFLYQNSNGEIYLLQYDFLEGLNLCTLNTNNLNLDNKSFRPLVMGYYVDNNGLYWVKNNVVEKVMDAKSKSRGVLDYKTFYFDNYVFSSGMRTNIGHTYIKDFDFSRAMCFPINNIGDDILTDGNVRYIRYHNSSTFEPYTESEYFSSRSNNNPILLCNEMEVYLRDYLGIEKDKLKRLGNNPYMYIGDKYLIKDSYSDIESNIIEIDVESFCFINDYTYIDRNNIYTLANSSDMRIIPRATSGIKIIVVREAEK